MLLNICVLLLNPNTNASSRSPVSMVRLDRRAVAVLMVAVGVIVLAAGVAAELTETWFEYRARTKRELKSRAKTSLDKHMGREILR